MSKSPKNARTFDQVCALNRDNFEVGDFWILAQPDEVHISHQKTGEQVQQRIDIPRDVFIRLVNWYQRPQKIKRRKP